MLAKPEDGLPEGWRPQIAAGLTAEAFSAAFETYGRIHIADFLRPADASILHRHLEAETDWLRCTRSSKGNVDIPLSYIRSLPPEKQSLIQTAAHNDAAAALRDPTALHYLFDTVRFDPETAGGAPLQPVYQAVHHFLNSASFLDFIAGLTGDGRARYVDARATRFMPGHYLTEHDDQQAGQSRLYAYVLNLSPFWLPDWGGLLQFIDAHGHVAEAYAPRMNALNIFKVPQKHAVSFVTPFARAPRLSITGWIRADQASVL